jgi:hypothetical protein
MKANKNYSNGGITTAVPTLAVVKAEPEFADWRQIYALFGVRRSLLYTLLSEGRIKGISLRRAGTARGKRLFLVKSVRQLLNRQLLQEEKDAISRQKAGEARRGLTEKETAKKANGD